jgi:acyl dehydratase
MSGTRAISLASPPSPTIHGPITLTDIVVYQGASGDLAAIHHDFDVARQAGYDKPFAPGMYPAGLLATWATSWLGVANIRRYKVRFANMLWPGDVLTCHGTITSSVDDEHGTVVELNLEARTETAIVITGWATFAIPANELA